MQIGVLLSCLMYLKTWLQKRFLPTTAYMFAEATYKKQMTKMLLEINSKKLKNRIPFFTVLKSDQLNGTSFEMYSKQKSPLHCANPFFISSFPENVMRIIVPCSLNNSHTLHRDL